MATLIKPPPPHPNQSPIESVLELTHLSIIDPNLFTNTRPVWHPPGARGIFGGAVIAQTLAAAQRTVPNEFTIHSMHCYFVLAGSSEIPIVYHVERVRDGRSFITRTVQARQKGRVIFTTTMSFVRENSSGKETVEHAMDMANVPAPHERTRPISDEARPYETQRLPVFDSGSGKPQDKKTRHWVRTRGRISDEGGHQAHVSSLAYLSDLTFIGTIARVHNLWRTEGITPKLAKKLDSMDDDTLRRVQGMDEDAIETLRNVADPKRTRRPEISMMVSLDHTIYFHSPRDFRADEWMFTDMETPWAGDGRGLVTQRVYTRDGRLVATCIQEGLVRLKQHEAPQSKL